jgi:DNA-binding CsgD family transcriptional regulator
MAKIRQREKAIQFRNQGLGIKEIARKLEVSSSTVSYWCRDISLSKDQILKLSLRSQRRGVAGLLTHSEKIRAARAAEVERQRALGNRLVQDLTSRDITMLGLGLYWGEGYKRGNEEFGFTNSDPNMILFYLRWLKEVWNIQKTDLIARVSINVYWQKRDREIKSYWAKKLLLPIKQFTKTSFIKAKIRKEYSARKAYFGTVRIKVRRGAQYRRQVLGAIENIRSW